MRRPARQLLLAIALTVIPRAAEAYEINPLKNKYSGNSKGIWDGLFDSVHEDITDAAVHCDEVRRDRGHGEAEGPTCVSIGLPLLRHAQGNKYDPLIRGVWWNDDSNQLLWALRYPKWALWMRDARGIATRNRNWLGQRKVLNGTYRMQYRSHYGDLQFLHAMANSDGETAQEVRRRVLAWSEFAYAIALGDLDPEMTLSEVGMDLTTRYFEHQPGWTINHLFLPTYRLEAYSVAPYALGSILHLVQDSYSEGHTSRRYDVSERCPRGRITQFLSYVRQEPVRHTRADKRGAWNRSAVFTSTQNPVEASARILGFARTRANWVDVVKPYLEDQVFCLHDDAIASGPGAFGISTD